MAIKKVKSDLIPLRAGIVRLTPLDANGTPIRSAAITTKRDFLTSTQVSTTRNTESLANGNGQDMEKPLDETFNFALNVNVFDPKFHKTLQGFLLVNEGEEKPFLNDITVIPTKAEANATFKFTSGEEPVAVDNGKYYFEIRDAYGNLLESNESSSSLAEGKYHYDPDTKTLSFAESYADVALSCVYYITGAGAEGYKANPVLSTPRYMLEVFAEMQSASSGEVVDYYAFMPRAISTGDLPNVTSQKSITNAITYNFKSAPVPEGVSPFEEYFRNR